MLAFIVTSGDMEIIGRETQSLDPANDPMPYHYTVTFTDTATLTTQHLSAPTQQAMFDMLADWLHCDRSEDAYERLSLQGLDRAYLP
jgi:hypothetical protein